ncbi:cellulose synthase complex periplasmic endoglucanase BcsZ [Trinickia sp. EG282A]|uniref:cellulose synthase complex periplasmic endoglucanase BcsZ n=1 Tax=Trinickia sp. EG282A TaxID=3237013 RepID=UPI0034D2CB65
MATRSALVQTVALALSLGQGHAAHAANPPEPASHVAAQCDDWHAYRLFIERDVSGDGRVIDASTPAQQTTTEGQAYAMFFALVANDRATFDRLLGWTRANLASNRFDATAVALPAWLWGRRPDGSWGVLDPNSAADADLWLAYDLIEAGRLWREPEYRQLGEALAQRIASEEITDLPGLGTMLLPGPHGFVKDGVTRVNPSYIPLPVLRRLAHAAPKGPWNTVANNSLTLIKATAPQGFAPDWAAWQQGRFGVDPQKGDTGSYDAIRVYLWAGLTASGDTLAKPWLAALGGMRARVDSTGFPPEKVATATGTASGEGPLSYWGALAPYFSALGDKRNASLARLHLSVLDGDAPDKQPLYYDRVLGLFGTGFIDGRFRFDVDGRLVPNWRPACG